MNDDDELIEAWRDLAQRSRRRHDDEAEDHVQDAIVAALDERHRTGRSPRAAAAWLRTVARRREVDSVRRAQCERRVAVAAFVDELDDDVGEVLDRHEARWLAAHVDQLPPTTRDVVRALASGRTQCDVAAELALTPRAVEAHVRRARLALRRVLERAGSVAGILLGGRRWRHWRRAIPVTAAGVAAAVGMAMLGTGDPQVLVPIPPRPHVLPKPDDPVHAGRPAAAPDVAAAAPVRRVVAGRRAVAAPRAATAAPSAPRPADPAPPPAPDPVGTQVVLVSAKGSEYASQFPTEAGAWYQVVVGGTYSYNGRAQGMADCGHYVPEETGQWTVLEALFVDGAVAPCARMPLDSLHRYEWRLQGTGRPVRFAIQDLGGTGDNQGYLAVTVTKIGLPPLPG